MVDSSKPALHLAVGRGIGAPDHNAIVADSSSCRSGIFEHVLRRVEDLSGVNTRHRCAFLYTRSFA